MSEQRADDDPLVGRRLGSYVVERRLGAGGMGAVYVAVQPEIGKRVAVKFLAPMLSADAAIVARFFDEARAVNLIQHDNIVDVFDFGRTGDGHSYFVMELLSGRSLGDELGDAARFPEPRARDIARQIADALTAAHHHGIVHRDLKPDNVFLSRVGDRDDFVRVLDFGIAKLGEHSGSPRTVTGAVMGTPGFMAPEQAQGLTVDVRADVYALGVLLYRMLGGAMPFSGATLIAILQDQLRDAPRPLRELAPGVSPAFADLVHRLIRAEPEARPASMAEVLAALSGSSSPGASVVVPSTVVRGATPRGRSARPLLAGAALLVLSAAAYLVVRRPGALGPPPPRAPIARPAPARSTVYPIEVRSDPPGATIFLGARDLGTTPTRLSLDGPQQLRLHRAGYFDESVAVQAGAAPLTVMLRAVPAVAPVPPPVEKPTRPHHRGVERAHGIGIDD